MIDNALQVTAAVMLLYGLHEMGNVRLRGPLLAGTSEVIWVGVGIWHSMWGLVAMSVALGFIQSRTFVRWYKHKMEW